MREFNPRYFQSIHILALRKLYLYFKNGEIYDSVIQGDWFRLSCSDQMVYKFLMLNLQETKALTIGGVAPLNMVSCVSVMMQSNNRRD